MVNLKKFRNEIYDLSICILSNIGELTSPAKLNILHCYDSLCNPIKFHKSTNHNFLDSRWSKCVKSIYCRSTNILRILLLVPINF